MSPRRSVHDLRPTIELHIEELVLHGFAPDDRDPIRVAIQTELARLFVEQGGLRIPARDSDRSHVNAGASPGATQPRARIIGRQIAESVFSRLVPKFAYDESHVIQEE